MFAAGDVASRVDAPHPKSGVYAVRVGPQQPYTPQKRTPYLLSCDERRAIASWGDWSAEGHSVWRWKYHIDRAFVARYTLIETSPHVSA